MGDSIYPDLGNPGYNVLHYEIKLDVDPLTNSISAVTLITARASENLEIFNLDLSGLEVYSITVNGDRATFTRSGQEMTVRPVNPLTTDSQFEVEVHYAGSPEPIPDPGISSFFNPGWQHRDGVIYTLGEPSGSMTWFPSNNHPTNKATYEIQITVPESIIAASNGILADTTIADGKTTYTWQMDDLMATYLAAVYIGEFDRIDHGQLYEGGPRIRNYVYRNAPLEITQALSVIPEAIRFFEGLLGPYPFDAYGIIVMPFSLNFALENQTLSVHGSDAVSMSPGIIAHEIAHQWLGNSVTLDDWSDTWLNEGFATYMQYMFEAKRLDLNLDEEMSQIHTLLSESGIGPPKGVEAENLFDFCIVFKRGAATLHALRLHVGDETFFEILRTHYDRSAGSTTNTVEFLGIVDEFAGPEAVNLVESWLFDETVPSSL